MAPGKRGRKKMTISVDEITHVKYLIEQCIVHYMNKKETEDFLYKNHYKEHVFTRKVWERLEAENKEFFKAYYTRLEVKSQVTALNSSLTRQGTLMGITTPTPHVSSSSVMMPCISSSTYSLLQLDLSGFPLEIDFDDDDSTDRLLQIDLNRSPPEIHDGDDMDVDNSNMNQGDNVGTSHVSSSEAALHESEIKKQH